MNSTIRLTLLLALTTIFSGILSSCQTAKGVGRDLENLGNKIENTAQKNS